MYRPWLSGIVFVFNKPSRAAKKKDVIDVIRRGASVYSKKSNTPKKGWLYGLYYPKDSYKHRAGWIQKKYLVKDDTFKKVKADWSVCYYCEYRQNRSVTGSNVTEVFFDKNGRVTVKAEREYFRIIEGSGHLYRSGDVVQVRWVTTNVKESIFTSGYPQPKSGILTLGYLQSRNLLENPESYRGGSKEIEGTEESKMDIVKALFPSTKLHTVQLNVSW